MSTESIKKLCEYIDKTKYKNYPINNYLLNSVDEYIKNSYFKMLAVVLQSEGNVNEEQKNLLQRMIAGAKCDYTMQDYFRQGLSIETKDFESFMNSLRGLTLRYRFILDGLILNASCKDNVKGFKLLASLAETLKISKEELQYLVLLGKAILEQNTGAYFAAQEQVAVNEPVANDYLSLFVQNKGIWQDNDVTILYSLDNSEVSTMMLDRIKNKKTNTLKLLNLKFNIADYALVIENYQKVLIEKCTFIGKNSPITLQNCAEVVVKDSVFQDFMSRTLIEESISKLSFMHCTFRNCKYKYQGDRRNSCLGGVFYSKNIDKNGINYFIDCIFENCGANNGFDYYSKEFISNCKSYLDNCKFTNCWHYYYSDRINMDCNMFPSDSQAVNCSVKNSDNIKNTGETGAFNRWFTK